MLYTVFSFGGVLRGREDNHMKVSDQIYGGNNDIFSV